MTTKMDFVMDNTYMYVTEQNRNTQTKCYSLSFHSEGRFVHAMMSIVQVSINNI